MDGSDLNRRDFQRLAAAALGGVAAGSLLSGRAARPTRWESRCWKNPTSAAG